jgi:tRNA pseudouridine38-40 synthase
MHEASQALLGEHDFSAFRAAACQSKTSNRRIISTRCYQRGPFTIFDVKANAFLLHMVRNLAGALLEIGRGKKEVAWMSELLASRDRKLGGLTAPPDGLYLVSVDYPSKYKIPQGQHLPIYLKES